MPGAYDLESFGYRTRAVATNKCPGGAYRGVGFAVATFVRERMVEILSRKLGEDRIDFRVRSCGDWCAPRTTPTGLELRGDFGTVIARVAAEVGEAPADPSPGEDGEVLTGTGYALYAEPVSPGAIVFSGRGMAGIVGYDDVRVRLAGDGRFAVATSSPPIGQGTETTFAQVVAQAIGCPLDRVYVEPSSTHGGMDGTGTFASRSAASVAVACERAATRLRSALLQATAAHLGLAPDEVRIDHHGVSASTRAGSVSSFAELARILPREVLSVTERTDPGWGGVAYGAHACAVKVHTATGRVDIERFVVVEDCGEMINPGIVFNQALGGVAQATGMSLLERLEYDADGRPSSTGFADYLVPRAPDVPDIRLVHHRSAATAGMRLGAGEGGAVAAAAALANAVSDALGAEVNAMPFDPAEVWQICRERRVATLG
jgi:carbon-monoxide dehydrogenase large subunit